MSHILSFFDIFSCNISAFFLLFFSAVYALKIELRAKNQLDPSNRFDRTPTCDRQTQTRTQGHGKLPALA